MIRFLSLCLAILTLSGCFHETLVSPPIDPPPALAIDFAGPLAEGDFSVLVETRRPLASGQSINWKGQILFGPFPATVLALDQANFERLQNDESIGIYPCAGDPLTSALTVAFDCTFRSGDANPSTFFLVAYFRDDGDDAIRITQMSGGLIETRRFFP